MLRRNFFIFLGILFGYLILLRYVYLNFPALTNEEQKYLRLPRSMDDAKRLGQILLRCKHDHYYTVLFSICIIYTFLQSFAIPGSILLTIISGYLFPFFTALLLVCSCSAFGASICYYISHLVMRRLVVWYIPERVHNWQTEVEKQRGNMYNYMFFLRVTPILPNWFINLAGPIVNVPLAPFFLGTFFGVMPPSFLMIRAGTALQELSDSDVVIYSPGRLVGLLGCGLISILPILYRRYATNSSDASEPTTKSPINLDKIQKSD